MTKLILDHPLNRILFSSLVIAAIPTGILHHIAERDTTAVQVLEKEKLSRAFDAAHTISIEVLDEADASAPLHQILRIHLISRNNGSIRASYALTGNKKTPLEFSLSSKTEVPPLYTSPQILSAVYQNACRIMGEYRPTPPLFGTSAEFIYKVQKNDSAMYRGLAVCPMKFQDLRIGQP